MNKIDEILQNIKSQFEKRNLKLFEENEIVKFIKSNSNDTLMLISYKDFYITITLDNMDYLDDLDNYFGGYFYFLDEILSINCATNDFFKFDENEVKKEIYEYFKNIVFQFGVK